MVTWAGPLRLRKSAPQSRLERPERWETVLSKLRGYLALGSVGLLFVPAELLQRTVIAAAVRVVPSKRDTILGRWIRWIARTIVGLVTRLGGAQVNEMPRIPAGPGVLILMNHQSLMDIPLVVASMDDLYPKIVTRARYARGKPLISHMIRLYQYPLVDPDATKKSHVTGLEQAARTSQTALLIYPEGTRTRDGSIGHWKKGGLRRVLSVRSWSVHLVVADGFWRAARLEDFVLQLSGIQSRMTHAGPFPSPEPGEPIDDFVEDMKGRMVEMLEMLRNTQA